MDNARQTTFLARHEFLIRRLHSLSGLVPVGAFMIVHLITNASVLDGARTFQTRVDQIHSLGALLPAVEWTFIFLPLLFHSGVGVVIAAGALPNTSAYPHASNVRYTLQRVSAWIALVFIFAHVFHMHGWIRPLGARLGGAQFMHLYATTSTVEALRGSVWIQAFYLVGIVANVYHLANGLWTMGITWGLWITPGAQRRASYVCAAFGVGLAALGLGALYGMVTADPGDTLAIEDQINAAKLQAGAVQQEELARQREEIVGRVQPGETSAETTDSAAATRAAQVAEGPLPHD